MQHKRLFLWSVTASLAGFLFGFDTIVISGAEQKIEEVWNLGSGMHGICMSAALWGTVLGALVGGMPAEKFGRRKTLIWIGVLYLLSAIGSGMAPDKYFFIISRFIGGIGVGIATIASPMYISEIAPAGLRGRLAGMFQFNIVFGILVAFLSNYLIGKYMDESIAWRWMLGIEALPALIYSLMCLMICESPRWLIVHGGKRQEGIRVFSEINPDMSEQELNSLADSVEESSEIETKPSLLGQKQQKAKFFTSKLKIPIMLAFLVAFFNQLSGINAILYFAPRIFEWTGLGESAALLKSVGIGITNLIFTYVGLYLIDKFGRRTLLYIGSFGYIASLGLCSWAFSVENYAIVPACIFAFIAAHAVGQGAVIWVLISEIFPNRFRSAGQSLGSFTHWFFAASLTLVFPKMAEALEPAAIFGFFCFMMILQLVWVKTMVPETKGVSLEEMQKKLGIQ
ncbi:sugar porter family MFS transporter [Sedimentisphaera salicampi]|uniref:D-xylose transporter n=1 Tax=Sedimentisphaera salicampi TaxID=1941349 RepID=A0A1W6LLI5_9BACT|nr:sugar porter family MFS transporter [Sedimentisphaera salicampi]ARN56625.1 D-xylose transporter [Sedimentisphaera salicampi]OXU15512.1 D-xylose transporter [Sedimentisphaera salicampi]